MFKFRNFKEQLSEERISYEGSSMLNLRELVWNYSYFRNKNKKKEQKMTET